MVADILAAKLGYITGNHIIRTFKGLSFAADACFLLQRAQLCTVEYVETVSLLQVGQQNGFCLTAQTVFTVGKYAALVSGAVVEATDGNRRARRDKGYCSC